MPRRSDRRGWTRSVHTHRSDVGQALLRFSRSNNIGPRVFVQDDLYKMYISIKERRDGKIGRNAQRAFMETVEELITRELLYRHGFDKLRISDVLRIKFRCLRREIRIDDPPPHIIQLETAKKLNQIIGPQNMLTKYHLNRLCNDYRGYGRELEVDPDSDDRPRAPALQAWSSTSTVDGLEAWGESRLQVLHSDDEDEDEEQEDDDPEMEVDDDQEQGIEDRDRLAVVSFRSPVRPPQNLSLSYPTPDSAPRPSRSIRGAVPPTPTPLGRPGRAESKILGANGTDDDGGAVDDEAEDRGEGPSRLQIVRRIDWGQGGEGAEHQCEYRHELEELHNKFDKKSHDEKAIRSEHEALSALHGAIIAQRDALSRERDAIRTDRDAVVVERNYIVRERDALQARNGALEGENADLVGEKQRLEEEKAERVGEMGRLREQIVQLQKDLDGLREEKMKWEEEKVRDGVQRRDMEDKIRRLEQQVNIAEHRTLEIEGEYDRLKQGRQADMLYILQLQQQIKENRATLSTLQADFQTLKGTHETIQRDLTSARDDLRRCSDELAGVNAKLQKTTYDLGTAQEELRDLRQTHQMSEDNLRKQMEDHQCTKQMLEQERRELNAIIEEKVTQLRKCQEGLAGYERRVLSMNAYRETCLPMISGYV